MRAEAEATVLGQPPTPGSTGGIEFTGNSDPCSQLSEQQLGSPCPRAGDLTAGRRLGSEQTQEATAASFSPSSVGGRDPEPPLPQERPSLHRQDGGDWTLVGERTGQARRETLPPSLNCTLWLVLHYGNDLSKIRVLQLSLFLFSKNVLVIVVHLSFHINFRICLSVS